MTANRNLKKKSKRGSRGGVFASDAAASTYGKQIDERSRAVESVLAKRTTAQADLRVARAAEEDYRAAIFESVGFFAQVAEKIYPKVSADSRAVVIGALISAYGATVTKIHLDLVRATDLVEEAHATSACLPEFGKHGI